MSLKSILGRIRGEGGSAQPANWYDKVYSSEPYAYTCHYTKSVYYFIWAVIADRVRQTSRILEVGCGSGQLAELLVDQGVEHYSGFDFSKAAISIAKKRLPAIDFFVADAKNEDIYKGGNYDVVVCTEVLEHIAEDLKILENIPKGKRVIATVPSYDSESHVRFFTSKDMVLERYGDFFQSVEVSVFALSQKDCFYLLDGVR